MSGTQYHLPVREAMTPDAVVVDGLTTVSEGLVMMRDRNISSLIVERRNEQDEYGIVLVTDVAREVVNSNRVPARTHLYEVMTKPAPSLDGEMNVRYAIRLMQRLGLTHALVVEGRRLIGIVTLRDLVVRYIDKPAASG
ncbi:CBS domain-containing protein [Falsiroseomonas sp. HC035]|uniref:CBS domain-containing protein n=1 Tax=Falsiroseomonas sp. HC035 TaxID=3390999 RepID=UPI003D31B5E6